MDLHDMMEHQFAINVTGTETGKKYSGDFVYRRLNLRSHADADKLKARLNGPSPDNLSRGTLWLHEILSMLKFGITSAPDWWAKNSEDVPGYDLFDANVITEVFSEVSKFEEKVTKEIYGVTKGPSKAKVDRPGKD